MVKNLITNVIAADEMQGERKFQGKYVVKKSICAYPSISQISLWEIIFLESRRRILPKNAHYGGKFYKVQKLEQIFGVTDFTLKNPLIFYHHFQY
jgi:hypothetical protein